MLVVIICYFMIQELNNISFANCDYNISSVYQKTEFNTTKWVQAYHNCTLNTTIGLFYLDESAIVPIYDDFTTWIESDASGRLSQTSKRSTFINLNRIDDNIYLYVAKAGELQNFVATSRFKITAIDNSATTIRMMPLTITDTRDDYTDNKVGGKPQFGIQLRSWSSSTAYNLLLYETNSGNLYYTGDTSNRLNVNVLYYVRLTKSGTALNLLVDNDDDFSSPINNYNLVLHSNYNIQYILIPQSAQASGALSISGYSEYLDFGLTTGGYEEKGVIYTKDLLANTTEKSLIIGINGTAQSNTRIRLYTSTDNTTWFIQIDNNGLGQQELYEEILYEYSTLYVRVNITTTDNAKTPYLDELFYLHTALEGCAAPIIDNPYWIAILFISTPIIIMLLLILRRKG